MQKPITVQRRETKEKLYEALKESQLHLSVLKPVVDEIQAEIEAQYKALEQRESQEYEKKKMEEKAKDKSKKVNTKDKPDKPTEATE